MYKMIRKPTVFLAAICIFFSFFSMMASAADVVVGTVDDFDSYANDSALKDVWKKQNGGGMMGTFSAAIENTVVKSGKSMKWTVNCTEGWGWLNIAPKGVPVIPAGATSFSIWIDSRASGPITLNLQFGLYHNRLTVTPGAKTYNVPLTEFVYSLKKGDAMYIAEADGKNLTNRPEFPEVTFLAFGVSPDIEKGSIFNQEVAVFYIDSIVYMGTATSASTPAAQTSSAKPAASSVSTASTVSASSVSAGNNSTIQSGESVQDPTAGEDPLESAESEASSLTESESSKQTGNTEDEYEYYIDPLALTLLIIGGVLLLGGAVVGGIFLKKKLDKKSDTEQK